MAPFCRAERREPLFHPLAQGVQRQVYPVDEQHQSSPQAGFPPPVSVRSPAPFLRQNKPLPCHLLLTSEADVLHSQLSLRTRFAFRHPWPVPHSLSFLGFRQPPSRSRFFRIERCLVPAPRSGGLQRGRGQGPVDASGKPEPFCKFDDHQRRDCPGHVRSYRGNRHCPCRLPSPDS